MNSMIRWNLLRPWCRSALTLFLGLILLFFPDSLPGAAAGILGFVIAVIGAWLIISFFFGSKAGKFTYLIVGIILMVIGFSILRDPLTLATRFGQFVGILLLLVGIRGYTDESTGRTKAAAAAFTVLGAVLILMPMTASRMLISVCGTIVVVIGVAMAVEQYRALREYKKANQNIIDAG